MSLRRTALLVALAAWTVLSSNASAATFEEVVKAIRPLAAPERKAFLEQGARKERELVYYTSMGLTDYPKIVGAFEKAHPYVKVTSIRLTQSTIFAKIDTEARAGRVIVDAVASAPVEIWELRHKG